MVDGVWGMRGRRIGLGRLATARRGASGWSACTPRRWRSREPATAVGSTSTSTRLRGAWRATAWTCTSSRAAAGGDLPPTVHVAERLAVHHLEAGPGSAPKEELASHLCAFYLGLARHPATRNLDLLHCHYWLSGWVDGRPGSASAAVRADVPHVGRHKERRAGAGRPARAAAAPDRRDAHRDAGRRGDRADPGRGRAAARRARRAGGAAPRRAARRRPGDLRAGRPRDGQARPRRRPHRALRRAPAAAEGPGHGDSGRSPPSTRCCPTTGCRRAW